MVETKKVTFGELSWPVKIGLIGGWISVIAFAWTFIEGLFLAY